MTDDMKGSMHIRLTGSMVVCLTLARNVKLAGGVIVQLEFRIYGIQFIAGRLAACERSGEGWHALGAAKIRASHRAGVSAHVCKGW
jgi:hypothetical protein